jgi:hypothetical protein
MAGVDLSTRECDGQVVAALQLSSMLQSGVRWIVLRVFRTLASTSASPAAISNQAGRRPRSARLMSIAATTPRRPVADRLEIRQ